MIIQHHFAFQLAALCSYVWTLSIWKVIHLNMRLKAISIFIFSLFCFLMHAPGVYHRTQTYIMPMFFVGTKSTEQCHICLYDALYMLQNF